jgi:hypothetical protein
MLLGPFEPSGDKATIGGAPYALLDPAADVVDAALEASSFHPGRSGRDHLRVYCAVNGYPDTRADEALALVGLTDAARRPARAYYSSWRIADPATLPPPRSGIVPLTTPKQPSRFSNSASHSEPRSSA